MVTFEMAMAFCHAIIGTYQQLKVKFIKFVHLFKNTILVRNVTIMTK